MSNLNVVDLFAGCGGLSYGFQQAGFNVLLGIDNDPDAAKTFLANHPHSKYICGDIKKITASEIKKVIGKKKVDLLIGGPPCQGFSLSGKRIYQDERNSLYMEFFRMIDILQPKVALIENVPGLQSLYDGKAFNNILREFQNRKYKVSYQILKADEHDVPQIRKRIMIVGSHVGTFQFPVPSPQKVTLGEAIGDLPLLETTHISSQYATKPLNAYQKQMRIGTSSLVNHEASQHSFKTQATIKLVPEGGNYKSLPKEFKKLRNFHVAWTRLDRSKPCLTIDTGHRHHFHPVANRVPTVRECARIQSFPDSFVFLGPRTAQYRQVGNAVPPLLAKKVALELKKYFKK